MPHFVLETSLQGPLVSAFIAVSEGRKNALEQEGIPVPSSVRIRGLIDTGASITCIDPSVLKDALMLSPTGNIRMVTPSTGNEAALMDQYDVELRIPPANTGELWFHINTMAVVCSELLQAMGYHALIGRDVLEKCLFLYNGAAQHFTLAY